MTLHADDLPASVRAKLGLPGGPKAAGKSRAGIGHAAPCRGRCECGERFARFSQFERHARLGHGRWIIDLSPP